MSAIDGLFSTKASCNCTSESIVFLDDAMRTEYAADTPSSASQNNDRTGSCGNLFDLENAFCSKNLISRALSHKAFWLLIACPLRRSSSLCRFKFCIKFCSIF
uniref:Uncharacterized protein n=1 Tax=Opuntia streptacantha TaxID=393608 RepID=A0A7C9DBZ3_OPUST